MKLLLVSNDPDVAQSCKEALETHAAGAVVAVPDVGRALTIVEDPKTRFSHVLIDLGLPNSSALLVCDTVGKSPHFSGVKIWTISSDNTAQLVRVARQLGTGRNFERGGIKKALMSELLGKVAPPTENARPADPEQGQRAKKFDYAEKIRIRSVRDCLSRSKFDAYFAGMSKQDLFKTRLIALEISNASAVFPKVPPDDFLEALRVVALGISDHFANVTSRFTYNGKGTFICSFSEHAGFDPNGLIDSIRLSNTRADVAIQLIVNKLRFDVGPVKRAAGVFTSFPAAQNAQEAAPQSPKKVDPSAPPVAPRKPRVQTRLLKFEDQNVLPQ